MSEEALKFDNAYEQVTHFIQHFGLSSGYIGAAGMGYESEIELSANAPKWAEDSKDNIVTQLSMLHNYYSAEFADISIKKEGTAVYLKTWFNSGYGALDIPEYPRLNEEILSLFKWPKGSELADSNNCDPYSWSDGKWEEFGFYDPKDEDYVDVKMSKTKSIKLIRTIKRYIPFKEIFKSISDIKLYHYKDRGSVLVKSGETKWIDITDELWATSPY